MQTDAVPNFTASSQISRICSQVDGCFNNVWSTLFKTSLYVIFLIVPFRFFSGGSNFQRFPCKSERLDQFGNTQVKDFSYQLAIYIYDKGLASAKFSIATAVGIFQSLVGLVLVLLSDRIAKMLGEEGLL